MGVTKAITLRLAPTDHAELEVQAERLGIAPAILARMYVRAGIKGGDEPVEDEKWSSTLAALRGFAELRQRLPGKGSPPDVVQIVADAREERARRFDM